MQIVIEIPDEILSFVYEHGFVANKHRNAINHAMLECIELQKGHGRLIDADAYRKEILDSKEFDFFKRLDMQPTVIPATKGEEECRLLSKFQIICTK